MKKVVYFLGAGFSAPLGLPVMRDFLFKAKNMVSSDRNKYASLDEIFKANDFVHKVKSYYDVNLLNIEEIFSILEMEAMTGGEDRTKLFADFIKKVIRYYTPSIPIPGYGEGEANHWLRSRADWEFWVFGPRSNNAGGQYAQFVANLLNLKLEREEFSSFNQTKAKLSYSSIENPSTSYGVVTLNYDKVIENSIEYIKKNYLLSEIHGSALYDLPIAKLHGSVDGEIVAPTWNKWKVKDMDLKGQWATASKLLSDANAIRIIGYSLPTSDAYVRYLLESAVLKSDNLQSIDIICKDDEKGTMENHYRSFITFKNCGFKNGRTEEYLLEEKKVNDRSPYWKKVTPGGRDCLEYNQLEELHENFFKDTR